MPRVLSWVLGFLTVLSLLVVTLPLVPGVKAFDGRADEEITVESDEVIDDDLYVAGREVTINGTVHGDVFAAGTKLKLLRKRHPFTEKQAVR